jgi:hypothetical protein
MGRKKKVAESAAPEVKTFDYGDLAVVCKCGRTQIITKGVEKGLQLVLTTREDSFIQLRCDECDADIKLCFLEGVKPVEIEVKEPIVDESVQEESKQEQSL